MGIVEINLIPLQDNIFTNCKSELKYFEAGIAGTISVASPTYTLRQSIRDGENGYLARTFEWPEKLQLAVDHLSSYSEMAEKAHADCELRFSWTNQIEAVERALFGP